MNWFKKIASVTFSIADTDKVSQPMNLLDICSDISNFIYYEAKIGKDTGIKFDHIEPDTSRSQFDAPLGYINFYLHKTNVDIEYIKRAIEMYNQSRMGKIKIAVHQEDQSGVRKGNVIRLEVIENDTVNYEEIPDMNLSNENARALLKLLGDEGVSNVSDELGGQLNINEVKQAILDIEANGYVIQTYTQKPMMEEGEGGSSFYQGGRSIEQFRRYFETLKQMIDYVEQNNISNRFINYG